MERFQNATELDDLALKILAKFNHAFLKSSKSVDKNNLTDSIEFKTFRIIKLFLTKVMKDAKNPRQKPIQTAIELKNKKCLLRLLSALLKHLNPYNVEIQIRKVATERLIIL